MKITNMIMSTIIYNKQISMSMILDIIKNLKEHESHGNLDIAIDTIFKLIDGNADRDAYTDYDMAEIVLAFIESKEQDLYKITDRITKYFNNKATVRDIIFDRMVEKENSFMATTLSWMESLRDFSCPHCGADLLDKDGAGILVPGRVAYAYNESLGYFTEVRDSFDESSILDDIRCGECDNKINIPKELI